MSIEIDLSQIYNDKAFEGKLEQRVRNSCIQEGRAAFAFGQMPSDHPPYTNEDMTVSWLMGWWRACTEQQARKKL